MTPTTPDEFARRMMLLAEPADGFVPHAHFDADGDCIEFLAKADPFYAERIDDLVTVYYSQETGDVIGSLIKGVSTYCKRILEQMPGFKIEIQDGQVRLEHVFRARLWASDNPPNELATLTYRKLADIADRANVHTTLSFA